MNTNLPFKPPPSAKSVISSALLWTLIWIASALFFNLALWFYYHSVSTPAIANKLALEFLTGYLIEKSLSVDNLFVFYLIFSQFHIPVQQQKRIFFYGVMGAVIFRLLMILLGSYFISRYHWIIYIMGAFLLFTGAKMFFAHKEAQRIVDSPLYRFLQRKLPLTHETEGEAFFIKRGVRWFATPLFIVLILIEASDIVFAFDSIPAIFAITRDPFIIWTSNIFAILGLRSLYFLLVGMIEKFTLLKYGIAMILIFVGFKMVAEPWITITTPFSLAMIVGILVSFILISILVNKRNMKKSRGA